MQGPFHAHGGLKLLRQLLSLLHAAARVFQMPAAQLQSVVLMSTSFSGVLCCCTWASMGRPAVRILHSWAPRTASCLASLPLPATESSSHPGIPMPGPLISQAFLSRHKALQGRGPRFNSLTACQAEQEPHHLGPKPGVAQAQSSGSHQDVQSMGSQQELLRASSGRQPGGLQRRSSARSSGSHQNLGGGSHPQAQPRGRASHSSHQVLGPASVPAL